MKRSKKSKEKREYEFPGEGLSRFLIEWLNGPEGRSFSEWRADLIQRHGARFSGGVEADRKSRDRVVALLNDLKELGRVSHLVAAAGANDPLGWRTLEALSEKVNGTLRVYRHHDAIVTMPLLRPGQVMRGVGPDGNEVPLYFWATEPDLTSTPLQELYAAQIIRELDQFGWLGRVIPCAACGQWLYARKSNQTSHSRACRQEKYKQQRSRSRKHSQFLAEMSARKAARRTR